MPAIDEFLHAQSYPINTMTDDASGLSRFWLDKLSTTQPDYWFLQYLVVPLTLVAESIYVFLTK